MWTLKTEIFFNIPSLFTSVGLILYSIFLHREKSLRLGALISIIIASLLMTVLSSAERYISLYLDARRDIANASGYVTLIDYSNARDIDYTYVYVLRWVLSIVLYSLRPAIAMLFWMLIRPKKTTINRFLACIPLALHGTLVITSPFTHLFHYYDNTQLYYHSGPLHWTIYFVCLFYCALIMHEAYICFKMRKRKEFVFLIFLIISNITAFLLESYWADASDEPITNIVTLICLIFYNLFFETKTLENNIKEKEDLLLEKENTLKLSQIRPHFVFNTLTSIIDLCPEGSEAQKALFTFARYLRANTDSFENEHTIPFREELEHVKIFIELEKYSYGDRLCMRYDIGVSDFRLPSLSVQPLIENSVKHCFKVNRTANVMLKTWEDEGNYFIEVTDDGPGFDSDQASSDGKKHIGIENIRYRLREMKNAVLDYKKRDGGGTVATIKIPKDSDIYENTVSR